MPLDLLVIGLNRFVRAVAIGSVAGLFALTEVRGLGFFGRENDRCKAGPLVFAIAKRLVLGKSTGAVSVFLALFQFNLFGKASCDFWFVHG